MPRIKKNKKKLKKETKKGFTLVELLAVIIILAVVVGISIPAVMSTVSNAKKKAFATAADTCADWLERQYQLYIVDPTASGFMSDLLKTKFSNAKDTFQTFDASMVTACGLKNENIKDSTSRFMINSNGRICVILSGNVNGGDYQNMGNLKRVEDPTSWATFEVVTSDQAYISGGDCSSFTTDEAGKTKISLKK